jgi:hypothetical protein
MALDTELIIVVKQLSKEMKFGEDFEKTFLKYLENESNFQCNDEDRQKTIEVLRDHLKKI